MDELTRPGSALADRLARLGDEFLAEFLGRELTRRPDNLDAISERAHALTRLGRHREAFALDRALVDALPDDPVVRYNFACSLALLGRTDAALDALERALDLGFDDHTQLAGDDDLAILRDEPRFRNLLARLS